MTLILTASAARHKKPLNWTPPFGDKSGKVLKTAAALETELEKAGIEALLDGRDERPGVKFNDADLMGCPHFSPRPIQGRGPG